MLPTRSVPRRRPRLWKRMGSWPIGRHWLPPFCVALAVYFGCSGVVARPSASSSEVGRPLIHNYSRRDFGAEVQQWDVAQDARGIMYFANNAGVIEFDGRNWRLIELPSRIGVRALASDATGANRIYVGAGGDFGYLAPDAVGQLQFTSLMPAEARQDRSFDQVFTRQRRWRRRGESMRWSPWPVRWMIDGNHVPDPVGRHALDPRDVSDDFCDRSE